MSTRSRPNAEEQARQILERAREDGVEIPDWLTKEQVMEAVDPEKPVPANYRRVLEQLMPEGSW